MQSILVPMLCHFTTTPELWDKQTSRHVARKESICFCYAPMAWLALETSENMVALNVDFSVWIITVVGPKKKLPRDKGYW